MHDQRQNMRERQVRNVYVRLGVEINEAIDTSCNGNDVFVQNLNTLFT